MAIDIFRGFNRLKLVVQGLTVAAGIAAIVFSDLRSDLKLETAGPDDSWHIATRECDLENDAINSIDDVPAGLSDRIYWISLCFRAAEFPEQGGTLLSTEATASPAAEPKSDPWDEFRTPVDELAEQQINQLLVPYKVDKNGMYWGNEKYSSEVTSYVEDRVQNLSLSPQIKSAALEWAKQDNNKKWRDNFELILILVLSILVGLEVISRALGWTIRGFLKNKDQPSSDEETDTRPL